MTFIRALRRVAFVEGVSTLVLFGIAMPLKYLAGLPLAVRIVGSIHGFLFVALVVIIVERVTRRVADAPLQLEDERLVTTTWKPDRRWKLLIATSTYWRICLKLVTRKQGCVLLLN